MKRICSIVLVILFILSAAACSSKEEADVSEIGNADKAALQTPEAVDTKAAALDLGREDTTRITSADSSPENRFLETAVENFQKNNPGIVVEIKTYTSMGERLMWQTEDGGTVVISKNTDPGGEKYIKTINTELLSGVGPDIFNTYEVPCSKFADNGFLTDINLIIRQDAGFDTSAIMRTFCLAIK